MVYYTAVLMQSSIYSLALQPMERLFVFNTVMPYVKKKNTFTIGNETKEPYLIQ